MTDLQILQETYLQPSDALLQDLAALEGDIMLLGGGGKMGPSLAKLAKLTIDKAGLSKKVISVSRFSETGLRTELESAGIETIVADLLDDRQLQLLPNAQNLLYLAGTKFGTTGRESFTWAMNAYLPGRVAEKFSQSRIVAFSTGNVYPLMPVSGGGADEGQLPGPIGEYAQSCLGRERIFQHFSLQNQTPVLIYRLNYAIDFRYGVLLEIARAVLEERAIDLSMGSVNVIWQNDANEMALRCLLHTSAPAKILNITGPEMVSVRWLAHQFGERFEREPKFVNEPQTTALLSNASASHDLFGYPRVSLKQMIDITACWLQQGGDLLNKPTHFQERNGQF